MIEVYIYKQVAALKVMAEEFSIEKQMWTWEKSLTSILKEIIQYIKSKWTEP